MSEEERKPFLIDFIDPLFAVALHIGFTHGIMEEQWFKDWTIPQGQEAFDCWAFGLGFLTIILSWVGYHESIRQKPLRGLARFILDVLLVMSYAVILVKFKTFSVMIGLLVWVYFLFVFWDIAKVTEYRNQYNKKERFIKRYRRECVTLNWFIVFVALMLVCSHDSLSKEATLILAYIATIFYRITKSVELSRVLFGGAPKNVSE